MRYAHSETFRLPRDDSQMIRTSSVNAPDVRSLTSRAKSPRFFLPYLLADMPSSMYGAALIMMRCVSALRMLSACCSSQLCPFFLLTRRYSRPVTCCVVVMLHSMPKRYP